MGKQKARSIEFSGRKSVYLKISLLYLQKMLLTIPVIVLYVYFPNLLTIYAKYN